MRALRLTITLVGPDAQGGEVLFEDFRGFCVSLSLCLRRTEEIVCGGPPRQRYRIVDLRKASATMALEPVPARAGEPNMESEIHELFIGTVNALETGQPVDPRLRKADLEAFRGLADPLHRGYKEVRVAGTSMTDRYVESIDKIVGTTIPSEGFVTGRLERLNVHNRTEFVLFPPITGFSITCVFPEEMYDQVYAAVRRNVTVFGLLSFKPDSPYPERVQVKRVEVHPPDEELPKLRSLRGTWLNATNGLSSIESVQKIRDE